jgi:chemotaxis protein CheX
MRADYINPFIKSLDHVFKTMLNCDVKRGTPYIRVDNKPGKHVSGVIGLSGKAAGAVVLSLSEAFAISAAAKMLDCAVNEIDADVCDVVGELTNMVAGAAKAELDEYELSISLPNVITGESYSVRFPSKATPICVPFDSDSGPLTLEVGLVEGSSPTTKTGTG